MAVVTPGSTKTSLNGATPVTIVAAPAGGVYRTVLVLRFSNLDSAVVTITLQKDVSGTPTFVDQVVGLAINGVWKPVKRDEVMILNPTTDSLKAVMAAPPATTNPICYAEWIDKS